MLDAAQGNITMIPRRKRWYEMVRELETFHINNCRADRDWSIRKTAKELDCSSTTVWNQLYLARGLRVYPDIIKFKLASQAEKYIFQKDGRKRVSWTLPKD